jgi:CheY-like chemotaxis protein
LALFDARMPQSDGFSVAERIRADPGLVRTAIVMVTTDKTADTMRCRELGFRSALKPLRRAELIDCVRTPVIALENRAPVDLRGLRVLLADDSEDNRFLVRNYLKDTGVYLDEVADGEAVVRMFRSSRYDIVLVDVEMPLLDGYSATRAIRAWESQTGAGRTPILALTAHALKGEAQKSIAAGCDAHLTKPIKKPALLDAIREFAKRNGAQLEQPPESTAADVSDFTYIDKSLEDIVPGYLDKRRQELGVLRSALHNKDFELIRTAGHKMRGSGGGYGFPLLTELGQKLEAAAKIGDAVSIGDCISALSSYLERLRVEFR